MEKREQVFCFIYEGKILVITKISHTKRIVEEVPFCDVCFGSILTKLRETKKYPSAEMLVKDALEIYTDAKLYKLYNGLGLSDDKFYIALCDWARAMFGNSFLKEQEQRHKLAEDANLNRRLENGACYCGRERHYTYHRRPGAKRRR